MTKIQNPNKQIENVIKDSDLPSLAKDLFEKEDREDIILLNFQNSESKFTLKINNIAVGYLTSDTKKWNFEYSDDFKEQHLYHRLVGFSNCFKCSSRKNLV